MLAHSFWEKTWSDLAIFWAMATFVFTVAMGAHDYSTGQQANDSGEMDAARQSRDPNNDCHCQGKFARLGRAMVCDRIHSKNSILPFCEEDSCAQRTMFPCATALAEALLASFTPTAAFSPAFSVYSTVTCVPF
jgi:hypothetical protein